MINLLPWRENRFAGKKRRAMAVVATGYVLLCVVAGAIFFNAVQQEHHLRRTVMQLTHDVNQHHLNSKQFLTDQLSQQQLAAARTVIWRRYRFIENMIQLIVHMPNAAMLTKLHCAQGSCDLVFSVTNPAIFSKLFKQYHVQDVKPGEGPLWYQVAVTVAL